jgi:hypothetical protein
MTPATTTPTVWVILRTDARRGPKGERFRGLEFPSADAAFAWIDAQPDATRRELAENGWHVRPVEPA